MKRFTYEYVIFRYTHDVMSGECLNVAVMLRSSLGEIAFKVPGSFDRVKAAFPGADTGSIRAALASVQSGIQNFFESQPSVGFSTAVSAVIPEDESSLQAGRQGAGVAFNLNSIADELLERFVLRCESGFNDIEVTENRPEKTVWGVAFSRGIPSNSDSFWGDIEPKVAMRA